MLFNHFSSYPTFQVFLGFIVAAALTMVIMPAWIKLLKRTHVGQQVRADGPESHLVKQGTPTMGGVIMLVAVIITTLLVATPSLELASALVATILIGALGLPVDLRELDVDGTFVHVRDVHHRLHREQA